MLISSTSGSCNWVLSLYSLSPQQRKRIRSEWQEYQRGDTGEIYLHLSCPRSQVMISGGRVLSWLFVYDYIILYQDQDKIKTINISLQSVIPIIFTRYTHSHSNTPLLDINLHLLETRQIEYTFPGIRKSFSIWNEFWINWINPNCVVSLSPGNYWQ